MASQMARDWTTYFKDNSRRLEGPASAAGARTHGRVRPVAGVIFHASDKTINKVAHAFLPDLPQIRH